MIGGLLVPTAVVAVLLIGSPGAGGWPGQNGPGDGEGETVARAIGQMLGAAHARAHGS